MLIYIENYDKMVIRDNPMYFYERTVIHMTNKDKFIEIYRSCITREGSDKLLDFLCKSDFFTAPASTRFHGSYEGGLLEHSLNVYECLCDFVKRPRFRDKYGFSFSDESVAIVALLHDLCKVNFYKTEMRS